MQEANQVYSAMIDLQQSFSGPMEIVYGLTESNVKTDGCETAKSYGIRAELMQNGNIVDKSCVDDVSCTKDDVLALMRLLAEGSVTPVTLHDVVEDWLGR